MFFWGWVLHKSLRFWEFGSSDWPAVVALSFGTYATIQTLLRYVATPVPQIKVEPKSPLRLGPVEEQAIPPGASAEVRQSIDRLNRIREYAVHHLEIWNHDVHWLWRPLVSRVAPEGCMIRFKYTKMDSSGRSEEVLGGEWLFGRWSDTPEPVTEAGFDNRTATANRRLPKMYPSELLGHSDAYAFRVGFAMKKVGEPDFYHFNDESYAWGPGWRNPHWVLGPGTYRIDVRLTGYGLLRAKTATFCLKSQGPAFQDWMLQEWTDAEK